MAVDRFRPLAGRRWVVAFGVVLSACGSVVPPRWAEGGAPLTLGAARWDRESGGSVELRADGRVLVNGDLAFVVDRVGRVTDGDYEPYAVLLPDGQLVGSGHQSLGRVGVTNAAPPGGLEAWLMLSPEGPVTYFDRDGERRTGGFWRGCRGPVLRACTLVTQLIAVQSSRPGPSVGVVGIGVGIGF